MISLEVHPGRVFIHWHKLASWSRHLKHAVPAAFRHDEPTYSPDAQMMLAPTILGDFSLWYTRCTECMTKVRDGRVMCLVWNRTGSAHCARLSEYIHGAGNAIERGKHCAFAFVWAQFTLLS